MTYLGLLFALAIGGALLASAAMRWQVAAQREREAELLARGNEIRRAIADYAAVDGTLPPSLDDLLTDRRGTEPRHHLRRLYADPFTGRPDWRLLRDAGGRIRGVASRDMRVAWKRSAVAATVAAGHSPPRVGDWEFVAEDDARRRGRTP